MRDQWKLSQATFQADTVCPMMPVWPWSGHRNFAYDLALWLEPGRIAELGVHWGTSFFAFAQAARDGGFEAELVGVDTFQGDEHAGTYGEEVFSTVRRISAELYPEQRITLHRMFFSQALGLVEDGSVNVLHIDGLHTYEAVKEDFETWLPKLADEAVVLFHDTAEYTNYGSARYWAELRRTHPSFEFTHSWGLGVLFPKGDSVLREMRAQGLDDRIQLYEYRAEAELSRIKLHDLSEMARKRMTAIEQQQKVIASIRGEWAAEKETQRSRIESLRGRLGRETERVSELEARIREAGERIAGLSGRAEAAEERGVRLGEELGAVRGRMEAQGEMIGQLRGWLDERERTIGERDAMIERLEHELAEVRTDLELLHVRIEHAEDVLVTHRREIAALLETKPGRRAAAKLGLSENGSAAGKKSNA